MTPHGAVLDADSASASTGDLDPGSGAETAPDELARLARGETRMSAIREEIVSSWCDSLAAGLRPDGFAPVGDSDNGSKHELLELAGPVIDRLGADLAGTDVSALLSDDHARIVARQPADSCHHRELDALALSPGFSWRVEVMGTNALGLATAHHAPALVDGEEHFLDVLRTWTTAAAPIADPRTGHLLGAVALVCPAHAANSLLLPLARRAAREVEHRLLEGSSARHRVLEEHFLRARRRGRTPLVVVGEQTIITNTAAARLIARTDQPKLWALAADAMRDHARSTGQFTSSDGRPLVGDIEPVRDGTDVVGAVLRLRVGGGLTSFASTAPRPPTSSRPTFGWHSLTESERSLAELVATGVTNKEAAARLFLSRHTIDSHLRHIFRKLDINSRVELARVVTAHLAEDSGVERVA
jgi:DNA-binding CsgD family transcriptional regulator